MSRSQTIGAPSPSVVPHVDIERAVLGALLVRGDRIVEIPHLSPDDFYREPHRRIFATMRAMQRRGVEIDLRTLVSELGEQGMESVGGASYLTGMSDAMASTSNVAHYAEKVRECADARYAVEAVRALDERLCREPSAISNGCFSDCVDLLGGIRQRRTPLALVSSAPSRPDRLDPAALPGFVGEIVNDLIGPHLRFILRRFWRHC